MEPSFAGTFSFFIISLVFYLPQPVMTEDANIVAVFESSQKFLISDLISAVASQQVTSSITVKVTPLHFMLEDEEALGKDLCGLMAQGVSLVLDMTWLQWTRAREHASLAGVPYLYIDTSIGVFTRVVDDYLRDRKEEEAMFIVETDSEVDQAIYKLMGLSPIRTIMINEETDIIVERMKNQKTQPTNVVIHGTQKFIKKIYKDIRNNKLIKIDTHWVLMFHDWKFNAFRDYELAAATSLISLDSDSCCRLRDDCQCTDVASVNQYLLKFSGQLLVDTLNQIKASGSAVMFTGGCTDSASGNQGAEETFTTSLRQIHGQKYSQLEFNAKAVELSIPLGFNIRFYMNKSAEWEVGAWTQNGGLDVKAGFIHPATPRLLRMGTIIEKPWSFYETLQDGSIKYDTNNKAVVTGYCPDFIRKLAEKLNADYEIIVYDDFGTKQPNGSWTGLVGALVGGSIEIAVAPMTTTTDREEAVDFVSPYFEASGISIIVRKPVREKSMFKFLEVLKLEVWLGIICAIVLTAILLFLLDRFSPYSARNDKSGESSDARKFSVKECFWFVLTSFTPHGGGETPKPVSCRILVAAYWLFVILMLATFTANLAAFLTVERMQSTVGSMDELVKQEKIKYTTVANSTYHEFFQNMASAEEDLYNVWKDLTLESKGDKSKYIVWDYPNKEQYTKILKVIDSSSPVASAQDGIERVLNDTDGNFAFIHDASQLKYEMYSNCNLTEIGQPFAEKPYAVAVQQGSLLGQEIGLIILELQKDRFFSTVRSKYWNSTVRTACPKTDDSDGISLESLGGVFIAALCGIAIALAVLGGEVLYYRHNATDVRPMDSAGDQANKTDLDRQRNNSFLPPQIENRVYGNQEEQR